MHPATGHPAGSLLVLWPAQHDSSLQNDVLLQPRWCHTISQAHQICRSRHPSTNCGRCGALPAQLCQALACSAAFAVPWRCHKKECLSIAPCCLFSSAAGVICAATERSLGSGAVYHRHLHRPAQERHHLPGHHLCRHSRPGCSLLPPPLAESPGQADWLRARPLRPRQVRGLLAM